MNIYQISITIILFLIIYGSIKICNCILNNCKKRRYNSRNYNITTSGRLS